MRIALISHTHFHWTGFYARYFLEQGHELRVMSLSRETLDGVPVDYIGSGTPVHRKALHYFARLPRLRSRLRSFAPDVVFVNGRVVTVDGEAVAEAFAVRGDRFVAVGSNRGVLERE